MLAPPALDAFLEGKTEGPFEAAPCCAKEPYAELEQASRSVIAPRSPAPPPKLRDSAPVSALLAAAGRSHGAAGLALGRGAGCAAPAEASSAGRSPPCCACHSCAWRCAAVRRLDPPPHSAAAVFAAAARPASAPASPRAELIARPEAASDAAAVRARGEAAGWLPGPRRGGGEQPTASAIAARDPDTYAGTRNRVRRWSAGGGSVGAARRSSRLSRMICCSSSCSARHWGTTGAGVIGAAPRGRVGSAAARSCALLASRACRASDRLFAPLHAISCTGRRSAAKVRPQWRHGNRRVPGAGYSPSPEGAASVADHGGDGCCCGFGGGFLGEVASSWEPGGRSLGLDLQRLMWIFSEAEPNDWPQN